ncbi:MAG: hypothetical protein EOL93_00985 [Epsilonproteobacteria bacterium]|nr:hypothetical protein [Campylobacterota bacterium]
MFGFLVKGATYYVLWQKFQKHVVLIIGSLIAIVLINTFYNDLFAVMKVNHKESLYGLLMLKWLLIIAIVGFVLYTLKHTSVDKCSREDEQTPLPPKSQEILDKKEALQSISDVILQKYTHA